MQLIKVNYLKGNKTATDMRIIVDVSQYDVDNINSLSDAEYKLQQSVNHFTSEIGSAKSNLSQSTYKVEISDTAAFIKRINMISDKETKVVGFEITPKP